ncbi:uncharacterized protein LOC130978124 [Arachis stenosperma]|uniref:uncharacterized protein LOC130978124 n=1 Tax=Arachis stenosperma TaxID=217475 RepID=UPI0025AD3F6A|nr:uncharacterized protein LOC130978124 [Arachis stenosperma]
MAQSKHIDKVLDRHSDETIANNCLRLKTFINAIRWLAFQACAIRGDDESPGSLNRKTFIELIKLLASCNQNVNNVLENAPENAQYISPGVQKDILHIFARKVRAIIREEIGDSKFCIIIDEARDESKREQMSMVLRFVDKHGCVQERFFDLINVSDTYSLTLKTEISSVLFRHNLDVQNLRGQGYDGASNMHGEWNGLQALFLKDCPFTYYIHCLAHQLQLALVFAAKEVCYVHQFFSKLTLIVKVVTVSPKRHDHLRIAQANNVANLIANDKIYDSLLCMFDATCEVLEKSTEEGNFSTHGDASAAYDAITSFEFVFVLYLMRNILEFNGRFNDNIVELLTLSSTLDLKDNYKFFNVNKVCELVERFYPGDFSDQEKFHIRMQAQHYELDITNHVELTNLCTISELCQGLTKTEKSLTYPLIDRLIRLVLTLPVSIAITERSFSAMNIVKNRLRNKMEDELLANCLLIYIEKKIAERFDTDFIIDKFYDTKNQRVPLR